MPLSAALVNGSIEKLLEITPSSLIIATLTIRSLTHFLTGAQSSWRPFHQFITAEDVAAGRAEEAKERTRLALLAGKDPNAFETPVERPVEVAEATELTALLQNTVPSRRDWRNITLAAVGFVQTLSRTAILVNTITKAINVRSDLILLSPMLLLVAWIYGLLLPVARPVSTTPYTLLLIYVASILSDFSVFYSATSDSFDSMSWNQQTRLVAHIIDFILTWICIAIAVSFPMHLNGKPEVDEEGLKPALDDYVNLWQWVTFSWISPFVSVGRKDTVEENDVWQLSHLLRSRILMTKFRHFHRKSLLRRIVAANFLDLFLDFVLSIVSSTLGILQPYLLNLTLAALQADEVSTNSFPFHQVALAIPSTIYALPSGIHSTISMVIAPIASDFPAHISFTPVSKNRQLAYFYAIVAFLSQLVKTQSDLQHLYYSRRAATRTYGELVGSIYEKALVRTDITGVVASDQKGKDGKLADGKDARDEAVASADVGKIVSLIATDSQQCSNVLNFMSRCYEVPINMVGSCILLQSLMGWTAFVGFFTFLLALPVNYILMKTMFKLRKTLLDVRDKRMREMNQAIQAVKFLKFFAWEAKWMERIMDARKREVFWLRKSKILQFVLAFLWDVIPLIVCVISFTFFVLVAHGELTVAIAFPALQALSILTQSLTMIPMLAQWFVSTYASYVRIDKYLNEDEVPDWVSWQSAARTQEYDPKAPFDDRVGFEDGFFRWTSPNQGEMRASKPSFFSRFRSLFKRAHKTNDAAVAVADDVDGEEPPKDFELRDLNTFFKRGQLNLVCGPTGSGKSSLLSALLGEMQLSSGRVFLPKTPARIDPETGMREDVSYCAQQPWLQHQSIRDNILFGLAYDEERYEAVIRACALTTDLALLDDGDATEIGEKGVSLSGGQKARVALARAVYARSKTVILDDVLSAVDSHTAERLIHECLCGPLLAHRTIIIVTHHVDLIADLAAWVVQLEDGVVAAQGTPEDLRNQGLLSGIREKLKRQAEPEATMSVPAANDGIGKDGPEMKKSLRNEARRKLVEKEEKAEGRVEFRIYHIYLKASSYWLMSLGVFLFLLRACGEVSQKFWIRFWGESYYREEGTNAGFPRFPRPQDDVLPYLLGYIGLEVVTAAFSICANIPSIFSSLRASRRLYRTMLVSVLRAPSRWFDKTPSGRILNRFSKDIDTIDGGLQSYMTVVIESVLQLLLSILTILWGIPIFVAPLAVISGLMYWFTLGYISVSRDLRRIESNTRSPIIASFSELINGISTVRAFGAERFFVNNVYTRLDRTQAANYYCKMCNRWLLFRFDSLGACITLAASLIAISTNISSGMVGIVISQAQTVIWGIYWLLRFYTEMEQALNSVERVSEYMDLPSEPPAILESNRPPAYWPSSTGGVSVENLVLKYSPELDPVLKNISFEIRPTEKIGVVGRTGSGKSTLALAFFRFVDPEQGKIVIDGVDITSIGLEDLRSRMTIIPQDAVLFAGTIRENLDPFNEHSDEDCLDALRRVQLRTSASAGSTAVSSAANTRPGTPSADSGSAIGESGVGTFVDKGTKTIITLDTKVSEGGNNFSSGQRQLIAMARALLRRSTFVVMDESTASVDFATDVKIQEAIREEFKDSILITIAHRLRTVIDYDRIMVMDAGQIAEFDSPKNLLKNENGIFYSMCKKTGDFEELQAAAEKRAD
ncbi:uncharacterized protein EI90DRAFT_3154324 [Cantharellus anzutake]|uniref:uncharacterized protein n=1 Tax=Cantharellus anzutake TaxID=1750568 RepID=UPI001905E974|nr:uncharacterized protein EI90DRAFT_3154324 [Cantharellus anzutake]KAF8331910.1 hypothetical protein EI90DRAFT_3154324 [Cantharellus anzutake]